MIAPDQKFAASEHLFRRLDPRWWEGPFIENSTVPVHLVEFPAFSVNREKYSSAPEDVLEPDYHGHGIAAFRVRDVPTSLTHPDTGVTYSFPVAHDPLDDNDAHTEVRCHDRLGNTCKPAALVRKRFRELLRRKLRILRMPSQ